MRGSTNALNMDQDYTNITLPSAFTQGVCRRFKIAPHTWLYQFTDMKAPIGDYTVDTIPEVVKHQEPRAVLFFPENPGRVTGAIYCLSNSASLVVRVLEANVWLCGQVVIHTQ